MDDSPSSYQVNECQVGKGKERGRGSEESSHNGGRCLANPSLLQKLEYADDHKKRDARHEEYRAHSAGHRTQWQPLNRSTDPVNPHLLALVIRDHVRQIQWAFVEAVMVAIVIGLGYVERVIFQHRLTDHQVVGFVAGGPRCAGIHNGHREQEPTDTNHQGRETRTLTDESKKVVASWSSLHYQDYIERSPGPHLVRHGDEISPARTGQPILRVGRQASRGSLWIIAVATASRLSELQPLCGHLRHLHSGRTRRRTQKNRRPSQNGLGAGPDPP